MFRFACRKFQSSRIVCYIFSVCLFGIVGNNMKSHKTLCALCLFFILLFCAGIVRAQNNDSLFLRREVKIGEEVYGYRVYVPKNRKPKTKLPVMLYLHGNLANGTDNEKQIESFVDFVGSKPKLFDFIIVFPQARPESYWINEETEQALKALDQTIAEFNGDAQKLYLAGHSLGGYGTYTTAVLYPNKFAALVPVAGGIVPPNELPALMKFFIPKPILEILNAASPYDALAEKLSDAPVWIFHGAADESISVKESRNIAAALKKNGSKNFKYTEYAKTNHNDAFVKAFSDPKLYKWLGKQKLKDKNAAR